MRRSLAWLVAVPLMLAGSQAAHVLAYRLVYPESSVRLDSLVRTGHGYLSLLPFALALAGAVGLLSLAVSALDAARGRRGRPLPPWAFALLPLAGFAVQEHVERWLYSGVVPWHEFAAPTFLPGLLLQLPFGALAWLAARLLLRTAARIGRALAPAPPRPRLAPSPLAAPVAAALPPRRQLLARGLAKRGPPLLLGA
ncbi:MAG TPA: hypothetical protein VFJ77_05720 [Gaiellaceae bacterium]|nr:hypothetical protein [Gaiellaceae bacterium]